MTLAFNYLATRISTWCKQNIELVIMIIVLIVFVLMSRAPASDFNKLFTSLRKRHQTETAAIKDAYEKELLTKDKIHNDEDKKRDQINKDADLKKVELNATVEKRIEVLKDEADKDPDAITSRLSALTGIRKVKSEEK